MSRVSRVGAGYYVHKNQNIAVTRPVIRILSTFSKTVKTLGTRPPFRRLARSGRKTQQVVGSLVGRSLYG